MKQFNYILSIAIPTYNRATYLERCLKNIGVQIAGKNLPIEIIVSDNCSTDQTPQIIQKFIREGMKIRYIKNEENKGGEFNVAQCYLLSSGKYVLVLGDDDVLYNGAIGIILRLLNEGDYGVVHLKPNGYSKEFQIPESVNYENCSMEKFICKVSYYITFISSNIVNRNYLDFNNFDKYQDTNLPQVPLILSSILKAKQNLYVETPIVGAEPDNSGGYSLFMVFGSNFIKILDGFLNKKLKNIVVKDLLINFFPIFILKMKQKENKKKFTFSSGILRKEFSSYFLYWLFIFPLEILPIKVAHPYYKVLHYSKCLLCRK